MKNLLLKVDSKNVSVFRQVTNQWMLIQKIELLLLRFGVLDELAQWL